MKRFWPLNDPGDYLNLPDPKDPDAARDDWLDEKETE